MRGSLAPNPNVVHVTEREKKSEHHDPYQRPVGTQLGTTVCVRS